MRIMLMTVVLGCGLLSTEENDATAKRARAVIERAIEAKGGRTLLARFPAWHFKYRETFVKDGKETVEIGEAYECLARRQARYENDPDEILIVNGKEGWVRAKGKVTSLTPGQVADFHEYLRGKEAMLALLPLLSDDWRLTYLGQTQVFGKDTDIVQIRTKDGWKARTYWDQQTHLLAKAEYPHKRLLEPVDKKRKASIRESAFGGYKRVLGVMFHTNIQAFSAGKRLGDVQLTRVEILETLPEGLFRKPRE
jgi:hypothetical protein